MMIITPEYLTNQSIAVFNQDSPIPYTQSGTAWNDNIEILSDLQSSAQYLNNSRMYRTRINIDPSAPALLRVAAERLAKILLLRPGWDSYNAVPISRAAAQCAIDWLDDICRPNLPTPSIVPGSDGSIQLEWHTHGIDLEVCFHASTEPEFYFHDCERGNEDEGRVLQQAQSVHRYIDLLSLNPDR